MEREGQGGGIVDDKQEELAREKDDKKEGQRRSVRVCVN